MARRRVWRFTLKAHRQLVFGGKIIATAVMLTKLLLKFCGYLLIACWVTGQLM